MFVFYEKPGCINNTRQKAILLHAGVTFESRNLLSESWSFGRLRPFFGDLPVHEWFNQSAPQIKNGELNPRQLQEHEALAAMVLNPLLIRRPLIETDQLKMCGFDWPELQRTLGVSETDATFGNKLHATHDLEACANQKAETDMPSSVHS